MKVLRHLLAIAALPFVVAVVIPAWLARRYDVTSRDEVIDAGVLEYVARIFGVAGGVCLVLMGLFLFVSSLRRFATEGQGTLAPWDPPRNLVIRGPYRFVRNPMISGVLLVLIGEALFMGSGPHALWALAFFGINAVYIPLFEEPQLRRRFGASYIEYCNHVPRLVPRLRPWQPIHLRPSQ
ncbi:MAG TPA: isoprenylcysteine carboxylmethyltransferase family protein [Gemmatimonadaceae bacterium]|nr:isoprenylcysteine carboxylmethyltransferase family protein [Gemmatimonadaceae bacterium]